VVNKSSRFVGVFAPQLAAAIRFASSLLLLLVQTSLIVISNSMLCL
jgi:hypothetical protein